MSVVQSARPAGSRADTQAPPVPAAAAAVTVPEFAVISGAEVKQALEGCEREIVAWWPTCTSGTARATR